MMQFWSPAFLHLHVPFTPLPCHEASPATPSFLIRLMPVQNLTSTNSTLCVPAVFTYTAWHAEVAPVHSYLHSNRLLRSEVLGFHSFVQRLLSNSAIHYFLNCISQFCFIYHPGFLFQVLNWIESPLLLSEKWATSWIGFKCTFEGGKEASEQRPHVHRSAGVSCFITSHKRTQRFQHSCVT